jgi:hypothetical protein
MTLIRSMKCHGCGSKMASIISDLHFILSSAYQRSSGDTSSGPVPDLVREPKTPLRTESMCMGLSKNVFQNLYPGGGCTPRRCHCHPDLWGFPGCQPALPCLMPGWRFLWKRHVPGGALVYPKRSGKIVPIQSLYSIIQKDPQSRIKKNRYLL